MSKSKELVNEFNELVRQWNDLVGDVVVKRAKEIKKFSTIAKGKERIAKLKKDIKELQLSIEHPHKKEFVSIREKEAPMQNPKIPTTRRLAMEKGYKMYWNGTPCEHGHVSVRYTLTGVCKKCYQLFRKEVLTSKEIDRDSIRKRRNDGKIPTVETVS